MVGSTGGTCECGRTRARFSPLIDVCAADGFDHYEEYCCECLRVKMNWRYYEDDACAQCKLRQLLAPGASVALEVQQPFSRRLLDGTKSIETRNYELPAALLHRPLALIETAEGAAGVSALPDVVDAGFRGASVIGHIVFRECKEYTSQAQWDADCNAHLVTPESPYSFLATAQTQGPGNPRKFGWVVERCKPVTGDSGPSQTVPTLRRRLRSLYLIE